MFRFIKKKLYFIVAEYFRFFAKIQLSRWNPRVIVVTGSSGKTTLLHLVESQLKHMARYSHHANSTFGIPFDILGLQRTTFAYAEWVYLFAAAPFKAFKKSYPEKIYVAEVDAERPGEGAFLGSLLKPEVTLWLNSGTTHSTQFDTLVAQKKFFNVEAAIAYEFGYLAQHATGIVMVNGDQPMVIKQLDRTTARVTKISKQELRRYALSERGTEFEIGDATYRLPYLLPQEAFYGVAMTMQLLEYLAQPFDQAFSTFSLPPGRSSIFKGVKNTTLIDSSYNATPDGMAAMLHMFTQYFANPKWVVLGDMIELGNEEQREHEKLAEQIAAVNAQRIVLIGPRISRFTQPLLKKMIPADRIVAFDMPADGLRYIKDSLVGGETLLFKGARFLEGVIEHLLHNAVDAQKLCRREYVAQIKRKQWGL